MLILGLKGSNNYKLFLFMDFQQSSDPYFLTTVVFPEGCVNELTRLKLAVFDVRDREKEEVPTFYNNDCDVVEWRKIDIIVA